MDVESGTVPLRSQYTQRITADIEANRAEQEQLKARLAQLQDDETYLVGLQTASTPQQPAAGAVQETGEATDAVSQDTAQDTAQDAALPQQRDADPVAETVGATVDRVGTGKKGGRKKTAATPRKQAAAAADKRPSRGKAAKKTAPAAEKKTEAPLRERVGAVLLENPGEPRSASEVLAALTQAAPGTTVTPQAARQALESLIAAGGAVRQKQGRSVYYSAVATPAAPEAADSQQQDKGEDAA